MGVWNDSWIRVKKTRYRVVKLKGQSEGGHLK